MVYCVLIQPQPIQRLCKYPLLLQDLLRNTPVSDCPSSHDSIRQILETLRILVARINSATGNPVNKDRIQKTILLQGKIDFSDDVCIHPPFGDEIGLTPLCTVPPSRYIQRPWTYDPLWCLACHIPGPRAGHHRGIHDDSFVCLLLSVAQRHRRISSTGGGGLYLHR